MIQRIIKEDLLHYVWKTKQIDTLSLTTTTGLAVEILDWGVHNHDSGPDFFNGKVKIGDTIWAGNIEMHIFSSDWEKHSHDTDPAYDNVVLHVVYEADKDIFTTLETKIPCIELKERIDSQIKEKYSQLIHNNKSIPCEKMIANIDSLTINMWKDRLVAERLSTKAISIKTILDKYEYDWESAMYITLARYMGSRVNTETFELLGHNLPLHIIRKNVDEITKIEALLYGTAGMLGVSYKDEYFISLQREYTFLAKKYSLTHIPPVMWKFSKMRPANFPTVRIAQLAQILYSQPSLFSKILDTSDTVDLRELFEVTASPYWESHYRFDTVSKVCRQKTLTNAFIDLILINVVAPLLFLYGQEKADNQMCDRAITLLESIKSEKNAIISKWKELGVDSTSAMDSQALIHLKNQYCAVKRCLSCNIGNKIVMNIV